jgi:rare lipoprotein A (peptidoglycan hydrolase)
MLITAIVILIISIYVSREQPNEENNEPASEVQVGVVEPTPVPAIQKARASWYDRSVCGERIYKENCRTASGEIFDENEFTLACNSTFELGTVFEFCYADVCHTAVCNDRGDFYRFGGRMFDFSRGLFNSFAELGKGVIEIEYKIK